MGPETHFPNLKNRILSKYLVFPLLCEVGMTLRIHSLRISRMIINT